MKEKTRTIETYNLWRVAFFLLDENATLVKFERRGKHSRGNAILTVSGVTQKNFDAWEAKNAIANIYSLAKSLTQLKRKIRDFELSEKEVEEF